MKRKEIKAVVLALACAVAAGVATAASDAAERFLSAARTAYARAEYRDCTNSLVRACLPPGDVRADLPVPGGAILWHDVEGMVNVRDIGGWTGLRAGRVYRGSEPDCLPQERLPAGKKCHDLNVTAAGAAYLRERLGVKTDLDLRQRSECPHPDRTALGDGVRLVRVPLTAYEGLFTDTNLYAQALRVFADPANYPIYFHCWGGADRTGTIAFLLEGLCGVGEPELSVEYELTSFCRRFGDRLRCDKAGGPPRYAALIRRVRQLPGSTMQAKIAYCMEHVLGLSAAEIAAIRANLR